MSHIGDNPKALASVIEGLGGTIVDNETFSFPVEVVTETIPKLRQLGVECQCVGQFRTTNPRNGTVWTVAEFTACKV